jgi:hypothetical protein
LQGALACGAVIDDRFRIVLAKQTAGIIRFRPEGAELRDFSDIRSRCGLDFDSIN